MPSPPPDPPEPGLPLDDGAAALGADEDPAGALGAAVPLGTAEPLAGALGAIEDPAGALGADEPLGAAEPLAGALGAPDADPDGATLPDGAADAIPWLEGAATDALDPPLPPPPQYAGPFPQNPN